MRGSMTTSETLVRRGGNVRLASQQRARSLSTGPQARGASAMPDM